MKNSRWLLKLLGLLIFLLPALPVTVMAREGGPAFSRGELAQMLAPVALYPDVLLAQVLMGATYPLEVVEADRWVKRNPLLKGDNLDAALRDQDWDASVKSLCHVPAVLGLMSERLTETTKLGDAFLVQEKEVMETIQDLRARALREGNLKSNDKQKVTVRPDGTIVIEPADPETVYVPYYNSRYVYGPWWYPAWPPWYWGPHGVVVDGGVFFWPDFFFGFGLGYWGYLDWHQHTIIIDVRHRPRYFHPDYDWDSRQGGWRHEPRHRRGVVYRDPVIADRYAQPPELVKRAERQASRVRGPVTAVGDVAAPSGSVKPGGQVKSPVRQKVEGAPGSSGVGAITGQPSSRSGSGKELRRPEHKSVERSGKAAVAPPVGAVKRVEPSAPGPERRDGAAEVGRETAGEREGTPIRQGVESSREEIRPDGRTGPGRQGRQRSAQEPGGAFFGEEEGGGKRGISR